jgi:hypothetical protein
VFLSEVVKDEPDQGTIKRSATCVERPTCPLRTRAAEGAAEGAGEGAFDWVSAAVEALGQGWSLPSQASDFPILPFGALQIANRRRR